MKLELVRLPDPILREQMPLVTAFTPDLRQLAETMISLMIKAEGVGLAANQVGQRLQLFVYGLPQSFRWHGKEVAAFPPQAVVNPKVTVINRSMETMDEGCLSVPGLSAPIARPVAIRLVGFDLTGQPIQKTAEGYEARVIQHEVDHLQGKLFLDHVADPAMIQVEANA